MTKQATANGSVKSEAESVAATLAEKTSKATTRALETAQDTIADTSDRLQTEVNNLTKNSKAFVKDNPGVAIAGALGVGVLVGLALRNRY